MTASPSPPVLDSILLATYGAPESPRQIAPFLEAVAGGKGIPEARLAAVRARYEAVGGHSPLMGECRLLLDRLAEALQARGGDVPKLYWGNLFAFPTLDEAIDTITRDRRNSTLVVQGSAFGSCASCQRYRLAVGKAVAKRAENAPQLVFLPPFFDAPRFRRAVADSVLEALAWDQLDADPFAEQSEERLLLFTAHSLPCAYAERSRYCEQLITACNFVLRAILSAPAFGGDAKETLVGGSGFDPISLDAAFDSDVLSKLNARAIDVALAFQSRSGSPATPWLEPDVNLFLQEYKKRRSALKRVIVVPIGFLFENMETAYDLDVELKTTCQSLDLAYRRARCIGTSERFAELIIEASMFALCEPDAVPKCPPLRNGGECDFSCRLEGLESKRPTV